VWSDRRLLYEWSIPDMHEGSMLQKISYPTKPTEATSRVPRYRAWTRQDMVASYPVA
jgi:hypothetical protein